MSGRGRLTSALIGSPQSNSNSKLLRLLLKNNRGVNNGSLYGGLAHALNLGMQGYIAGKDMQQEQAGQEALAAGTQAMLGTPDGEINWNTARPDGSGDMVTTAPGVAPEYE